MKAKIWIYPLALIRALLMLSSGCKKKDNNNPLETGTVTDIEGNVYKTVKIGTQWWMAENLKTSKFNDGTAIPLVTGNTAWRNLITPGYCWYFNDAANKNTYGALYNWFTVNTGKLAPTGWHVPTDAEWKILTDFLGGENVAGGKMKEAGTAHWGSPNSGAENSSGFSGLPGGFRYGYGGGYFNLIGNFGYWWSSSEVSYDFAWSRSLIFSSPGVGRDDFSRGSGFSVRCLRDN